MSANRNEQHETGPDRTLVVGLGSIGQRHLRLLRARLPEAEIMALRHGSCDDLPAGVDLCTNSLHEAVAFAPQIAVIASPAPFHMEPAAALARAGTHLLVEKPMAANALEARHMAEVATEAGVVLQVGYNMRFLECLRLFRKALLSGQIGRVLSVRAEVGQYLPDWRPGRDWRTAVSARADLGGGVLLELSHEFDFLRWIFGELRTVRGWTGRLGELGVDVEDTVHAILEFDEPTPRDLVGAPPVAAVSMDFIRRDKERSCTAIGTDGTLTWDGIAEQVRLIRPGEAETLLYDSRAGRDAAYLAQIDAFLEAVRTTERVSAGAAGASDGIAVMNIVEALRRSEAGNGRAVDLELLEA